MNRFVKKYGVDAMGAMAVAIGYALKAQPLVLFSLVPVGLATNQLGGAAPPIPGSPLLVASAASSGPPFPACGFPDVSHQDENRHSMHF